MPLARLHERLLAVRSRIAAAAARAGRDAGAVRIIAVTKGHPLTTALDAVTAGLLDVGENRVQEALEKMDAWPQSAVRWHLIGHLQRNKAKQAVGRFALIHSLDSVRLADVLEAEAVVRGVVQDVLVEVNVADEPRKTGCAPAELAALVEHAAGLPHLSVRGLMGMAPLTADRREQRRVFGALRRLREERVGQGYRLPELSMGMTNDFEAAVEEGATMVRLGTALFGERLQ